MKEDKFSKEMCRSMIAMMTSADGSGKLGYQEFESLLNDIAKWKVTVDYLALTLNPEYLICFI